MKKTIYLILTIVFVFLCLSFGIMGNGQEMDPGTQESQSSIKPEPPDPAQNNPDIVQGYEASTTTSYGRYAGYYNTGSYNTSIGAYSGYSTSSASNNSFLGYASGYNNTDGYRNVFIGVTAGYGNSIGNQNNFIGYGAGYFNNTGSSNTFIGDRSGYFNTKGGCNTFIGTGAGGNSTGSGNVFLGNQAGYNETGSNKLYIANSSTSSPLIYGEFDNARIKINDKLGIGISPVYPLHMASGAYVSTGGIWTNASSRSLKENIRDLSTLEALNALNELNPVKFNYKVDKTDQHVGFIAEDVPALLATADRKGLSPMDITAVLTKVVQKLEKENEEYRKIISDQQQLNGEYKMTLFNHQILIRHQQQLISDLQERMAKIEKK